MKILYLLPHLERYGGIRRIVNLTNELSKTHEVYLALENNNPAYNWMPVKSTILSMEEALKRSYDIAAFSLESQHKTFRQFKADIKVHYILHYGVIYKDAESCLASYQEPNLKIVNSTWTQKKIAQHIGYEPEIVYGGINKDVFHPIKTKKIFDVMTYGDLRREWKGRGDVEIIELTHPELKVGYMYDINPSREDMSKTYCSSKIFLSASWYEGWNWMGLEAMACSVPVIMTRDGGSSDYATHEYNCLQVNPRNTKQMIKAIKRILNDSKLRRSLINNGLRTASQFTWEQSAKQFLRAIDNSKFLLDRKGVL